MAAEERLSPPIGDPPHVELRVRPAEGASNSARAAAEGYLAAFSRAAPLVELCGALGSRLGLPAEAVVVTYEGRTLEPPRTLVDNGVLLPGPAARRAGAKVELLFDTQWEVLERERRTAEAREAESEQRKLEAEAARLEMERSHAASLEAQEAEFEAFLEERLGPSRRRTAELAPAPEAEGAPHCLEPCGEEVRAAVEALMNATGCPGFQVIRVLANENQKLLERFQRAKQGLSEADIKARTTATGQLCRQQPGLACLGEFEAGVNEFPLWHATPTLQGARGICGVGFDIAFAGTTAGTAFSPGFYFAESSSISHQYAMPWSVNDSFSNLNVMLLCRVLCGNVLESPSRPTTEEEKERLTAMCLGPGGTFGPRAKHHCILGGGWAYVCLHRDQVYPAYVVIYRR